MISNDIWNKYHEWNFEIVLRNLRQFWNITSGIYAKYHVQIMLLFVYSTTRKRIVIFTCKYFKLSWNTTALSQSNYRNFACSSIKMKICHHLGCNDIGVVIATKWLPPHCLLYFRNDSRHRNLTKLFIGAFFSNTVASMFMKFKQNLKSVIEIFWNEVFIIRNTVRKGKSWFLAVICRKRTRGFWPAILPHSSFNLFKNMCERSWR